MVAFDSLNPVGFLEALTSAARVLEDHAVALDRLDGATATGADVVFEVPRAGSDLSATLSAAVSAAESETDFSAIGAALERGARRGCTGHAGGAAAELLAGFAEGLRNADELDASRYAMALEVAAERLTTSDDGSHPGGLRAVLAAAADSALSSADMGASLGDTIVASADGGLQELERGPVVDPRLAARGVVDAAAAGFLLVLDSLASVVTGEPLPSRPPEVESIAVAANHGMLYEIRCRLTPDVPGVETSVHLEDTLRQVGDLSVWQVSGDSWELGVLTTVPGAAIEAIVETGRPREVHIGAVTAPLSPLLDVVG